MPPWRSILFNAVVLFIVTAGGALAEPKRVLLIHSFGRDFGAWAVFARGFRAELDQRSPETVEFYDAALMTERFGAGQNEVGTMAA